MLLHRVKRKGQFSRVHVQLTGENTGEETRVSEPGPNQEIESFQLNMAGGPLDEEFLEKSAYQD
ncbi:hypothetical protein [Desulfofundulus sp.]|uniref:hypothetical protein n=1 Tax=Desulfofundulus sp. TaxID=2282750 RepID=UPI003C71C956